MMPPANDFVGLRKGGLKISTNVQKQFHHLTERNNSIFPTFPEGGKDEKTANTWS